MSTEVSLVIPVYNESATVEKLVATIDEQTYRPAEVILVDGGSTDDTVALIKASTAGKDIYRVIEAGRAMPGKGRNIGAANAKYEWIAFTDAGIKLDKHWLENLVQKKESDSSAAVIYGGFSPQVSNLFDKCAAVSYVPPLRKGRIRTKSIASCLMKKEVWEKTGGFPDWRAAEDLALMEKAAQLGFKDIEAPAAMVTWQLQPNLASTFRKFKLYSCYNVWAGRQAQWHYGIARQYLVVLAFLLSAIFHKWYWLLAIPVWLLARVVKRTWTHRLEFGNNIIFNPAVLFMTSVITLTIDAATFSGWLKALREKKPM